MKSEMFVTNKSSYCNMIFKRSKNQKVTIRQELVKRAQLYGIKATARHFGCSKNTVKEWMRRHKEKGIAGLADLSRASKHIPHKISPVEEAHIVACRKHATCYGPKRLKLFFEIKASEGAIHRVLKQNQLTRKQRKKYQTKQDLRAIKAAYKALEHNQEDVKHLYDQPHYWTQMQRLRLPKYQYSFRDTKSGTTFLGYANEYSEHYSTLFTEAVLQHLEKYGIPLPEVIVQTDNGPEFGLHKRSINTPGFVNTIEHLYGAKHFYIPPGMCNANADVESFHSLIEKEFFDIENFSSREDFFKKINTCQLFFNVGRPNFSKKGKTPIQIILEDRPHIDPGVVLFPVIDIDQLFRKQEQYHVKNGTYDGGQYGPKLPEIISIQYVNLLLQQICFSYPTEHPNQTPSFSCVDFQPVQAYL